MKELAELLGIHPRTVQAWRKGGLLPIDPEDKPLLFMGDEIKRFLARRRRARKHPLQPDQFFCPRCRLARSAVLDSVRVKDTGRRIGEADSSLWVQGVCRVCGCKVNRFATNKRLNPAWKGLLPTQAEGRLNGQRYAPVNSVILEGK
jgi:hypothetical protein